jgi:preprotein translocase subunit SecG
MTLRGGQPDGRRRNIEFGGSMQAVIIAIHLIIVSIMIGVILLQKSEGGGLGIGSTGGFLSSRGTANVLTRTTAILAATFFATSLVLSVLAGMDRKPRSIIQNTGGAPTQQAPGAPAGQGGGGGLLDTLRQREQPAAPAPPAGPQVPQSQ